MISDNDMELSDQTPIETVVDIHLHGQEAVRGMADEQSITHMNMKKNHKKNNAGELQYLCVRPRWSFSKSQRGRCTLALLPTFAKIRAALKKCSVDCQANK